MITARSTATTPALMSLPIILVLLCLLDALPD
jgi:hypothetical protein